MNEHLVKFWLFATHWTELDTFDTEEELNDEIELLELELPEGKDILLGDSNIGHMTTRHPEDFALYGEYIPDILREPDYVAQNKKDNSIEYVREVEIDHVFVKVAVRVSTKGQLFARSVYRLNPNRVRSFIDKGNLKKY